MYKRECVKERCKRTSLFFSFLKLGATLAGSELGVVRSLVSLGAQLILLLQHPVFILGGLALAGFDAAVTSPILTKEKIGGRTYH